MAWDDFRRFSQVDLEPPKKGISKTAFLDLISTNWFPAQESPPRLDTNSNQKKLEEIPSSKKKTTNFSAKKRSPLLPSKFGDPTHFGT